MDTKELLEKYFPLVRQNLIPLALVSVGLMFLGIGVIQFLGHKETEIEFQKGESLVEKNEAKDIIVDVSGEVIEPGVYKLTSDARIQDALIAAKGLADGADREYVAKYVNLAQKVSDGMKIYIPKRSSSAVLSSYSSSNEKINVNTASISELADGLPGVGKVTAEKIIRFRPYSSIEDLVKNKVVGQSTFEKIKEMVSVY
ncbi:MAG: hypothetical protein C4584_02510 [Armatimonadetes bacterium]|nr:MAG: hypothetical protein C4584_02510 [Armatimonadota bacterium]